MRWVSDLAESQSVEWQEQSELDLPLDRNRVMPNLLIVKPQTIRTCCAVQLECCSPVKSLSKILWFEKLSNFNGSSCLRSQDRLGVISKH